MVKFHVHRSILTIFMLMAVLVMAPVSYSEVPAFAATPEKTLENPESDLLQFTSAGHVLGFTNEGVMLASADHVLRTDFLNANPVSPQSNTYEEQDFSQVTYNRLWKGVDMVYEVSPNSILKSTYYVSSEDIAGSLEQIRLQYNRPVKLDTSGNLVTAFATGSMTESRPVAWQEVEGQKRSVKASYRLFSDKEVGFIVEDYLPGLPLVIDPAITWNTFLGGANQDSGNGIAVDNSGNIYIIGVSFATWGTPKRPYTNSQDAFVAKLDSGGNLTWNTFLGGANQDTGAGISVDSGGNIYVTGVSLTTWGTPLRALSAGLDAFVAKLDSGGNLTWNTFLGGANTDFGNGIAVDNNDNVYITGRSTATWGAPLQLYSGANDAFVAKLTANGALTWHTFMGSANDEVGSGIAVDNSDNVYITGRSMATWGAPVQPYSGNNDAFVAKLTTNGALTWNTFLGGANQDYGSGIAVDNGDNVYITGRSEATWGVPVRPYTNAEDAFVAKLGSNGALTWNTFMGGANTDFGNGIAVDNSGYVYMAGYSTSDWGSAEPAYTANTEGYAIKLDSASGVLNWSAFVGGADNDQCTGISLDGSGNVFVIGYSRTTWGVPQRAYSASDDCFVAKFTNPTNGGGSGGNPRVGGAFTPVNRLGLIVTLMVLALAAVSGGWLALRRRKVS